MKVLHVNENAAAVGGAERMLLETCALQQVQGHAVALLYADYVPDVALPFQAFRVPQSGGYRDARDLAPSLMRVVAAFRPDVIHLHNTLNFLSPFALRWLRKRVPTVKYVHDARLFCPRHQTKILARQGTPLRACHGPAVRSALRAHRIQSGTAPILAAGGAPNDGIARRARITRGLGRQPLHG